MGAPSPLVAVLLRWLVLPAVAAAAVWAVLRFFAGPFIVPPHLYVGAAVAAAVGFAGLERLLARPAWGRTGALVRAFLAGLLLAAALWWVVIGPAPEIPRSDPVMAEARAAREEAQLAACIEANGPCACDEDRHEVIRALHHLDRQWRLYRVGLLVAGMAVNEVHPACRLGLDALEDVSVRVLRVRTGPDLRACSALPLGPVPVGVSARAGTC